MATSNAALPPMGKISMIGIWTETMLYGVNCVMYGLCMFILLRGGQTVNVRWVLVVMSTILFLLCTAHVGASLQQLLEAFVYAPSDIPDYSTTYWLNSALTPRVLKNNLYATLESEQVLALDFILVWRLYVVFMFDWRVAIFPIILAAGCTGSVYAFSAVSTLPYYGWYGSVTTSLVISAFALGFTLNVSVTGAIVARLWWMGRTMNSLTETSTNRFAASIYMIVESGAVALAAETTLLVLFASKSPAALSGFDVFAQLAVLSAFLIVVQVGRTNRYGTPQGDSPKKVATLQNEITFRAGVPREQGSWEDISHHSTLSRSPYVVNNVHHDV